MGKQNIFNCSGGTYYLQLQLQYITCCVVLKYVKCSARVMWMWWSCNEYFLQYLCDLQQNMVLKLIKYTCTMSAVVVVLK